MAGPLMVLVIVVGVVLALAAGGGGMAGPSVRGDGVRWSGGGSDAPMAFFGGGAMLFSAAAGKGEGGLSRVSAGALLGAATAGVLVALGDATFMGAVVVSSS